MKIAQLVSDLHPVAVGGTKAIYSHVGMLTDMLVDAGHSVDIYASANSKTKGTLHSIEKPSNEKTLPADIQRYYTQALITECYKNDSDVDVIHSHFTLLSSFHAAHSKTPTLISIHSPIREEIKPLLQLYKNLSYVSFSKAQRLQMPELNWVANIYHGIDTNIITYNEKPQDYFLYLGRITEEKGVHFAIEAARAAGVSLRIAGSSYVTEGYWHKYIEPAINGNTIRYMGEANEQQKIELLQGAKALLFPTQYDETFGLVMIEAMACGTPVIAWRKGSVPEVVAHGKTGYVVDSIEGMVDAIRTIDKISRKETRERAVTYFSKEKMAKGYQKVYERLIQANKK